MILFDTFIIHTVSSIWCSVNCQKINFPIQYLFADGVWCPERHEESLTVATDVVSVVEDGVFRTEKYSRATIWKIPAVWEQRAGEEHKKAHLQDALQTSKIAAEFTACFWRIKNMPYKKYCVFTVHWQLPQRIYWILIMFIYISAASWETNHH